MLSNIILMQWLDICVIWLKITLMRNFRLAFILIITCSFVGLVDAYDDISNAIRTGNSKQLSAYIGTNIDLTIGSQEAVYSKVQAEQILRNFFNNNTPQSFTLLHKGASKEGTMYVIGSLVTKAGKTFRTSFYFKQSNKVDLLKELRFEME